MSLLGYVVGRDGDYERGAALLRESLAVLRGMRHGQRLSRGLCLLGVLEGDRGTRDRSVRLIGEKRPEFVLAERQDREASLAAAQAALGEEGFAKAWAEGQALTLNEAVEYALRDEAQSAPARTPTARALSPYAS